MVTQRQLWPSPAYIERKILFYRVDAGRDSIGRPIPFDPRPILRYIDGLSFPTGQRYFDDEEGHQICCWVDELSQRSKLRLGRVRRHGWPQEEYLGRVGPLSLPPNHGIAEAVHVVFFPGNIVGCEYNYYGPRISRLSAYFAERARCPGLRFVPIARPDIATVLNSLRDVRLFRLKIHASYAAQLAKEYPDAESVLTAAARLGDAEVVDLSLQARPRSRGKLSPKLLDLARLLISQTDLRRGVLRGELKGLNVETGEVELIDLLSAQVMVTRKIPSVGTRTKAPDTDAMYAVIEDAYDENSEQLRLAPDISLDAGDWL